MNHLKTNQSSRSLSASELKVPGPILMARLIFRAVMITKQVKMNQRKASLAWSSWHRLVKLDDPPNTLASVS